MKRTLDVVGDAPSFRDLLLPPRMVQSLAAAGFVRPSPVQQAAIPLARLGADAIVQAKAGTGKTLVFAVAAVERVDLADSMPQVLLLAPTREVALQAADVVAAAAGGLPLCVATLIGGLPTSEDERVLRRICHVVVGTPGRVLALLQRGALVAQRIGMLVLDEADRLLSESFQSDVAAIIEALPAQRQVLALSATYSRDTMAQLRALMRLPAEVLLCEDSVALLGVRQLYQLLPPRATTPAVSEPPTLRSSDASEGVGDDAWSRSLECLLHILSSVSFNQAVVFCNRKSTAESLASSLVEAGHAAGCLSSAHTQLQRIQVVNSLRDFSLRAVVSTDVAARGVDLEGVNLVVHFELPSQAATYMHRVGRAGRFGTRGISVALVEGQRGLHQLKSMLEEAGGGEVEALPTAIPPEWYANQPLDSIPQPAQPAPYPATFLQPPSPPPGPPPPAASAQPITSGSSGVQQLPPCNVHTASLWPDDQGLLPCGPHWPLRPANLNVPAASPAPAAVKAQQRQESDWAPCAASSSAASWNEDAEGEIDLSYTVLSPRNAAQGLLPGGPRHYDLLVHSAGVDVQRSDQQAAVDALDAAFAWPRAGEESASVGGSSIGTGAAAAAAGMPSTSSGTVPVSQLDAPLVAHTRRPLGSAQATSHQRQLVQQAQIDEAEALAAEAAYLEALADGALDAEEVSAPEPSHEAAGVMPSPSAGDEQAWLDYWVQYHAYYGCYPGGQPSPGLTPTHSPASSTAVPHTPPRPPAPAVSLNHSSAPPPMPVEPPSQWLSSGSGNPPIPGDAGFVRVPVALLLRYQELEWQDWRRRYQEWCAAFEDWKLAASPGGATKPAIT